MNEHPREFAAALIFNAAGEMLLLRRSPRARRWPGCWGIAGGGVEAGETPRQARHGILDAAEFGLEMVREDRNAHGSFSVHRQPCATCSAQPSAKPSAGDETSAGVHSSDWMPTVLPRHS